MKKFKNFQIVRMKLVHDEKILKRLEEIKGREDLVIRNKELLLFVKPRPALVIDSFVSKGQDETKYLIIPMTTKRSIANYYGAEYPLRIEIHDDRFNVKHSYLMLDNMLALSESCLKDYFDDNHSRVILNDKQISEIKYELVKRLLYLLNMPVLMRNIEEIYLGEL